MKQTIIIAMATITLLISGNTASFADTLFNQENFSISVDRQVFPPNNDGSLGLPLIKIPKIEIKESDPCPQGQCPDGFGKRPPKPKCKKLGINCRR